MDTRAKLKTMHVKKESDGQLVRKSFRIAAGDWQRLDALAKADQRSASSYIRLLLINHLMEKDSSF